MITKEKADEIVKSYNPSQKFVEKDNFSILHMDKEPDKDLYYCSMLDHTKGCKMEENKPFDCKIWPFRIMALNNTQVITLSPVCPVVKTRSLDELSAFAAEAQLLEKYEALYNGAVINTGENRLVLHQLRRGQLGNDVIAAGINKRTSR